MIIPLLGILFGALFGAISARRRQGKPLDLLQWAAVAGMIGGVIGLFILVYIERTTISA